jgi:hypothetical protein
VSKDFVDKKRHLIGSIINLMISTELRDSVDSDALVAFLDGDLAYLQPGVPYALNGLADFLAQQGASEGQIRSSFLFLHSKRNELALPIRIPSHLEVLPASVKDKLMGRVQAAGATLGNGLEGLALPPHIGTSRVKTGGSAGISMISTEGEESPRRRKGSHPIVLAILLLGIVAAGGGMVYFQLTKPAPIPPVVLPSDGDFLPCKVVHATGRVAVCRVNVNEFNKLTAAEQRKKAINTVAALKKMGKPTERMLLQDMDSPKTLALLP